MNFIKNMIEKINFLKMTEYGVVSIVVRHIQ